MALAIHRLFQRLKNASPLPGARIRRNRFFRSEPIVAALLTVGAAIAFWAYARHLATPYEDDAATTLSYARSLTRGWGLRLTEHSQVVEGFSNPLWMLLSAPFFSLGISPLAASASVGVFFGTATVVLVAFIGPAFGGRGLRLEDGAGAMCLATQTTFAHWAGSGMETPLHAFLLVLAAVLYGRACRGAHVYGVAIALGLLCLTRPEAPLYAMPIAVLWCMHLARHRVTTGARAALIEGAASALLFAAVVGAWVVFRWVYFGRLAPNTYFAKLHLTGAFKVGAYARSFVESHLALLTAASLGMAAGIWNQATRACTVVLAGLLAAGTVFVVWADGDWMNEWRFVAPLLPMLTGIVTAGLSAVRSVIARPTVVSSVGRRTALGLAFGLLVTTALSIGTALGRAEQVKGHGDVDAARARGFGLQMQIHAAELGMIRPLVILTDIGGMSLALPHAEVIDAVGLADHAIARHAGNARAREDYLVSEGLPAFISAGWGPSGYILSYYDLMAHYREPQELLFVLKGLSRDTDPRCPIRKAYVVDKTVSELQNEIASTLAARPTVALATWRCAFTYLPDDRLPPDTWRMETARKAEALGDAEAAQGDLERAVRHHSLATILSRGDPRRRQKTEALRERLFPPARSAAPSSDAR